MSLSLTIWDDDHEDELVTWQVGSYSDFACFRDTVVRHLPATRLPVLMTHSDCEGEWSVAELPALTAELETIGERFRTLPPEEPQGGAFSHTAGERAGAVSLYDCFHNVDGENLIEALIALCQEGIRLHRPISFE